MSYVKKIFAAVFIIIVAAFGFWYQFGTKEKTAENIRPNTERTDSQAAPKAETQKTEPIANRLEAKSAEKKELPQSILISTPFLAQAPFAVWDPLHEDACEEASLIMVKNFLEKNNIIAPSDGDVEIRKMIRYEEENGYGLSITMDQLAEIIRDYYGMHNYRIEKNITVEDIKRELADGRPVIVPAAGKLLDNPNFRNGGPVYHMLVVVGYDKKRFITNDPGTRKGEGYRYTFDNLYDAIHDWDEANILNGQKAYLVFD